MRARTSASPDEDELIASINVTPLVDIVLVLLVVLMVAAAFVMSQAIPLEPPALGQMDAAPPPTIEITIHADGAIDVDGAPVTIEQLSARAGELAQADREARAIIAAHRSARHGDVVRVIDTLRLAHITRYAMQAPAP